MYKRIRRPLIFIFVLLLILPMSGCSRHNDQLSPLVVTALAADSEMQTRLEFSGILVPVQTVEIASKLSGQVVALGFKIGDQIKNGDILVRLDTEALNGQLLAAQATLQSARAAAVSANNQAAISKINLAAAQQHFERLQELFAAGAISQSQLDEARDSLDIASQQYASASGPSLAQAEAAINSAMASVRNLQVQIGNATIKSPIDGILTTQNINPGQVVSANTTLVTLVDTSALKLKTTVEQNHLPHLKLGQTVDITVDSYPGQQFAGTITSIGPIAVSTGQVFPLEITLQNDAGLLAGLSAHTTLISTTPGIIIPAAAVGEDEGGSYVFVIADHTATRQAIKPGLRNDQEVQVLEGLNSGEQVAISNLSILEDGMQVRIP